MLGFGVVVVHDVIDDTVGTGSGSIAVVIRMPWVKKRYILLFECVGVIVDREWPVLTLLEELSQESTTAEQETCWSIEVDKR